MRTQVIDSYLTPIERVRETLARHPKLLGPLMALGRFSNASEAVEDLIEYNRPELDTPTASGSESVIRDYLRCLALPLCKYLPAALRPRYHELLVAGPKFTVNYSRVQMPRNLGNERPHEPVYATFTPDTPFEAHRTRATLALDSRLIRLVFSETSDKTDPTVTLYVDVATGLSVRTLQPISNWLASKRYLTLKNDCWFSDSRHTVPLDGNTVRVDLQASTLAVYRGYSPVHLYSLSYPMEVLPVTGIETSSVAESTRYQPSLRGLGITAGDCLVHSQHGVYHIAFTEMGLSDSGVISIISNLDWILLKPLRLWLRNNRARLRSLPRVEKFSLDMSKSELLSLIAHKEFDGNYELVWRLMRLLMDGEEVTKMVTLEALMNSCTFSSFPRELISRDRASPASLSDDQPTRSS